MKALRYLTCQDRKIFFSNTDQVPLPHVPLLNQSDRRFHLHKNSYSMRAKFHHKNYINITKSDQIVL